MARTFGPSLLHSPRRSGQTAVAGPPLSTRSVIGPLLSADIRPLPRRDRNEDIGPATLQASPQLRACDAEMATRRCADNGQDTQLAHPRSA